MSKLNFSIALKMTTDQFKKGADIVKNSLKQIQFQAIAMAGALGLGGVGLKNMVSRFVDVARETTRARVALRNISGGVDGFNKNMDFLVKTSGKWGQELNGMTAEFSKFSAAASSAGISIQDQHTIFESFTRTITGFGMSSEDAHLSYLALSQMMSKGKVSSEELRRQLGERMPIAMEAMARAVGVTIQELDGLLKAGKLVSKDVMMPFVKEMEKMMPEVNTDNIETSVNRLKNIFTKLTQDLKIGEYFKKIVDWAAGMLSNIQTSFARVALVIVNSIAGAKIFGAFAKLRAESAKTNAKILAEKQRTELQMQVATEKRIAAERNFENLSVLYHKASDDQKLQYYAKYTAAEKAMDKARLNEKAALRAMETAAAAKTTSVWSLAFRNILNVANTAFAAIKSAFATFLPMAAFGILTNFVMKLIEARKEAEKIKNTFSDYKKEAKLANAGEEVEKIKALHKIVKERLGTNEEINNAQSELLKKLGVEEGKQKDINKLVADRIALLEATASADFYARKKVETDEDIKRIYGKYGGESQMNKQFINAPKNKGLINNWLGWEDPVETDMSRLVELKKVSEDAGKEMLKAEQIRAKYLDGSTITTTTTSSTGDLDKKGKDSPLEKAEKEYTETLLKYDNQLKEGLLRQSEYNRLVDSLNEETAKTISGILGEGASGNATFLKALEGVNDPKSLETLEKKLQDIGDEMDRIYGQGNIDLKKRKDIDTELLRKAGWGDAGGDYATLFSQAMGVQQDGKEVMLHVTPILPDGTVLSPDELDSYVDNVLSGAKNILSKDSLKNGGKGIVLGVSSNTSIDDASEWGEGLHIIQEEYYNLKRQIDETKGSFSELQNTATKEKRDTTFDYKKSDSDILKEEYNLLKKYIQELKDGSTDALQLIAEEEEKLTSLSDALKLAELKEDIEDLNKSLFSESISGITGFADALDRASRSWSRIANQDMSGFERMVAIINAMGDTIKGLISTWETYGTIREIISKKDQAAAALEASQKVANDATEAASAATKSAAVVAGLTAEEVAAKGVMAAKSAAAYAGMPFVGVGLAAGQIAAMEALISSAKAISMIPGFKDGGIIGGSSRSGDKTLIRANAGEMVLTTAHQSGLWDAIKKGDFGNNGGAPEIKLKLEGKDIVGSIKNYQQYLSRR